MKRVDVADLGAHLSSHLRGVSRGDSLLVTERGLPIARVVPPGDAERGLVVRPALRPFSEAKRRLRELPPLGLSVNSLDLLREDRRR